MDAATAQRSAGIGGWGIRDARGFQALSAIGMIDTATRTALLTFLPFLLLAKGLTVAQLGLALAVLFAGGAAGKFVCGLVAERVGIVSAYLENERAGHRLRHRGRGRWDPGPWRSRCSSRSASR